MSRIYTWSSSLQGRASASRALFVLLLGCAFLLARVDLARAAPVTTEYHGVTAADHLARFASLSAQGYRPLSLSLSGTPGSPRYAAVWVKKSGPALQAIHGATLAQFVAFYNTWTAQGYQPTIVTATGPEASATFTGVMEQRSGESSAMRLQMRSGLDGDNQTFQYWNKDARSRGKILTWAASYGDPLNPRFAAIWAPNPAKAAWNVDGIADAAATARQRTAAQLSGWARPSFVTTSNAAESYFTAYRDDSIGDWQVFYGLTAAEYENWLPQYATAGYFPAVVQAGGTGAATRYAVLFAKEEAPRVRTMTRTGSPANAAIDKAMEDIMKANNVRGAALAVTQGTRLVVARGYTYAEPGYPVTEPTTLFRTASCSKNLTAIAIESLIQQKRLSLGDKVQEILQLRQPNGALPVDSRFAQVTVQQLLSHTSGLVRDSDDEGVIAFWSGVPLPVNKAQIASFTMTKLNLFPQAIGQRAYSNFGYFLLGLVIEKRDGVPYPTAIQNRIGVPLQAPRIRVSSHLPNAAADEARYHDDALVLFPSAITPARPLVPVQYGSQLPSNYDSSGAMSVAAVDFARVLAMYSGGRSANPPVLSNERILEMLQRDVNHEFGWDLSNDVPFGDHAKGGYLDGLQSMINLRRDDIAYVVYWNTDTIDEGGQWYPTFPSLESAIRASTFATDLFPSHGMTAPL